MKRSHGTTLVLFDVDGTLAVPSQKAAEKMLTLLSELRRSHCIGLVGTGTYAHQEYQLGGPALCANFDFVFSENGTHAFANGREMHRHSVTAHLGPQRWAAFYASLTRMVEEEQPERARLLELAKPGATLSERGTFIDTRSGVVNICPIGRTPTLTKAERATYEQADRDSGLRHRLMKRILRELGPATEYRISASIGGQIGIDLCPCGWDKTYCLRFIPEAAFPTVHFFGDKTVQILSRLSLARHACLCSETLLYAPYCRSCAARGWQRL